LEMILEHYDINRSTLPAAHMDYSTIVLEGNRQLFVKKTPLQLIKAACLDGWSTYEGRRKAVMYLTGSKQKVPIPVNPRDNIYAFPTQSPKEFNCSWIFYHHVKFIHPTHVKTEDPIQSIITFKNHQELPMNESCYVLEKQMQRTAICILSFSNPVQNIVQQQELVLY
jgi:competence protein ComK